MFIQCWSRTIAKELISEAEKGHLQFDYVFSAIGGGGLISGVSTYLKQHSPKTKIIGVEPIGASSMYGSCGCST